MPWPVSTVEAATLTVAQMRNLVEAPEAEFNSLCEALAREVLTSPAMLALFPPGAVRDSLLTLVIPGKTPGTPAYVFSLVKLQHAWMGGQVGSWTDLP